MRVLLSGLILLLSLDCYATGSGRDDQRQDQDQHQEQDQNQHQDQSQTQESEANASAESSASTGDQANAQSVSIENRTPGRSFVGGGDSSAADQKVFAVSGGWLTGSAGFRFDLTDKDARKLRVADQWRAMGRIAAADQLTCSIRSINKPFGGKDECYSLLASSNTAVEVTRYSRRDNEQDAIIRELQRELELLREQTERCDEGYERAFEKCVRKQ